jgi:hypothetical protein
MMIMIAVEDGKLYSRAREVLETFSRTDRIDGFRYWSVRDVAKHSKKLREDLDAFARARRHQLAEWEELSTPTLGDAASRVLEVADDYSDRALEAAKEQIANVGNFFSGDGEAKRKAVIRRAKSERRRVLRKARATIEDLKSQIGTTHVEPPVAMKQMQDNVDEVLQNEAVDEATEGDVLRDYLKTNAGDEVNTEGIGKT